MTPKVLLCIADGFGHGPLGPSNPMASTPMPHWQRLCREGLFTTVATSGEAVGLPEGQMGNSEVGHMIIGAGRVVWQDLPRIHRAIEDGSLANHPALQRFWGRLAETGGRCHLMGLYSDGGVHSHAHHLQALAETTLAAGVQVVVHLFLDGRDGPPFEAETHLASWEAWRRHLPPSSNARLTVGTLMGRYWAMDRNQRMDRTRAALDALLRGQGRTVQSPTEALYDQNQRLGDEFVPPCIAQDYEGARPEDGWMMSNFRPDRIRQLWQGILDAGPWAGTVTMASAGAKLDPSLLVLFAPQTVASGLGETVATAGKSQWRVAESEKYAHITYFLNGGQEAPWPGETRLLIASPSVAHYNEAPAMAADALTDALVTACEDRATLADLTVVNYANADMVGHTGCWESACEALRVLDRCFGRLYAIAQAQSIDLCITADHGNIERMIDPDSGMPHTAHTTGPVPCVLWSPHHRPEDGWSLAKGGSLADIAPTLLQLLQLPQPTAMTGHSLLLSSAP